MHQSSLTSIIECVGQTGADPAYGVNETRACQKTERWSRAGKGGCALRPRVGQTLDNLPAGAIGERATMKALQNDGPGRSTQVWHAQRPQILLGKILDEIQRNDVRMLQAGQGEVLLPGGRRQ